MNIWVQMALEIDPTLNLRLDRQSGEPLPEPGDRLYRIWHGGRAAMELALQSPKARVTAFSIGEGHEDALYYAMAAGAERAVILLGDPTHLQIAQFLSEQNPDVIFADRTAGILAAHLNWAHLAGIVSIRAETGFLMAEKDVGRGNRDRVTAKLPAFLRVSEHVTPSRYIAIARLKSAQNQKIERYSFSSKEKSDQVMVGPLQLARARTKIGTQTTRPRSASGSARLAALMGQTTTSRKPSNLTDDKKGLSELAEEFVRYLAHHRLLPLNGKT